MIPEPISESEMIGLCSPADKGDFRLTLYLYGIEESGESRDNQMRSAGPGLLQYPPLAVNLFYLLTAYSTTELKSRALDEHRILGKAMQVIYDNAILRGSALQGTLAENNENVRIALHNLSTEEMTKIWNFNDVPYKLSVAYRVGPVLMDSTRVKRTKRVMEVDITLNG